MSLEISLKQHGPFILNFASSTMDFSLRNIKLSNPKTIGPLRQRVCVVDASSKARSTSRLTGKLVQFFSYIVNGQREAFCLSSSVLVLSHNVISRCL